MSGEAEARVRVLEARVAMLEQQLGRRRTGTYDRDEFLVRAFEDAPIGMALVGLNERILEANASLCAMLGYGRAELLQKTVPDITHPDDHEVEAQPKGDMKAGEALSFVVEKRYVRADGSVLTGRLSVSALYDEQARPAYFLGQLEDVTRERAAEAARLTREAQFRTLFDHAPDALVLIEEGGWLDILIYNEELICQCMQIHLCIGHQMTKQLQQWMQVGLLLLYLLEPLQ
jgi:PAS domain S-box-containing protein